MRKSVVVALCVLIGGGCGVHVGNGMKRYASPHGFEVVYSEKLNLTENSNRDRLEINNRPLLTANEALEQQSYVSLSVSEPSSTSAPRTIEALKELAARENPSLRFEEKNVSGARGIVSKQRDSHHLSAKYYYLTNALKLVRASVSAFDAGQGMELIAPIMDTFKGN